MDYLLQVILLLVFLSSSNIASGIVREKRSGAPTCSRFNTTVEGTGANKTNLYLLIMAPYPSPILNALWDGGSALVPAARLAVEEVNSARILGDYQLKTVEMNSGCSLHGDQAAVEYIENIFYSEHRRALVGAVGPACTDTDFIPELIGNRNPLVQVTIASSPKLRNKTRFPYIFSTISSSKRLADAIVELAVERNWTRVGIILEITTLFLELHEILISELANRSISHTTFEVTSRLQFSPLEAISSLKLRVMVVLATASVIEKLLCAAYQYNGDGVRLAYPAIQWILIFRLNYTYTDGSPCTLSETLEAFNQSILMETRLTTEHKIISVTNRTLKQYIEDYHCKIRQHAAESNLTITSNPYANLYYDGVWALGQSLGTLLQSYNISEYLREGTVGHKREFAEMLVNFMYRMEPFNGASGLVYFEKESGEVKQVVNYFQLNGSSRLSAGNLSSGNQIKLSDAAIFIEDSFERKDILIVMPLAISIVFGVVSVLLVLTVFFFHFLNIAYRNEKYVKASSPKLNHLIFTGSYMMSIGLLIYIGTESVYLGEMKKILGIVLCYFYFFLLEVGLALILSTVLVRTWRIYRIFLHFQKPGGWMLKDPALICASFLLLIPVIFNIIVTADDNLNFKWDIKNDTALINSSMERVFIIVVESSEKCIRPLWHIIIYYLYIFLLMICSVALAIFSKSINRRYRVTKSISFYIYTQIIVVSVGGILQYLSEINHWPTYIRNLIFCFSQLCLLLECIVFIFMPPMIPFLDSKLCSRRSKKWFIESESAVRRFSLLSMMSRTSEKTVTTTITESPDESKAR